ncbi:zeta toxin family protein [Streptomyces sp. HF10]|uniref:zeta toxin family protein n=1 Tax=Streptomyces sp. HF10 TaxID=2692233 RepID=UPI001F37DE85|nr:zeta toxin family protein [Streptomyces sp. HF10]
MIDPAEIERYRLPEDENQRIFRERIVPDLLASRVSQETPTVVFLIGQPGAGKSRVTELVAAQLNQHGGFADIDSDLYKPYHPAYAELMARDDTLMAAYTRADGRAWMAQAEQYVRDHGLHAIIQETSQNAQAVAAKMRAYREAGARVEGLFMGVPRAMSNKASSRGTSSSSRTAGRGGSPCSPTRTSPTAASWSWPGSSTRTLWSTWPASTAVARPSPGTATP